MTDLRPVPFDPQLERWAEESREDIRTNGHITPDTIAAVRAGDADLTVESVSRDFDVAASDREIALSDGSRMIVTVVRPTTGTPTVGIYHIHGGGMIIGTRFEGFARVADWVQKFGVVAVLPEYRLAPEHPHPTPVNDCFEGLTWMAEHAGELGFPRDRLVVMGGSAGGGLAAAMALRARDESGPALTAQVLLCPMIDDTSETVAARQADPLVYWTLTNNHTGWEGLLGERCGTEQVDCYAAPARTTDFSGLPPAYIEVGAAELFRDEDADYASGIWQDGGSCELHVWAGGFHGFELRVPDAEVSRAALAARDSWFRRVMGYGTE